MTHLPGGTGDAPRWRDALVAVALAVLMVTAGCSAIGAFAHRDNPDGDRLGWEAGYWADATLNVTTEDGLNESERRAVVARTMARVELIRDREFQKRVPVKVVSREEYRASRQGGGGNRTFERWNNQVWEALFLVSEDRDVADALDEVYGESVQGFYAPGRDEIVIVSDSETPTIDTRTLAHELVHALQDQHDDLSLGPSRETQDGQLAVNALIEGDANVVQSLYTRRCERDWSCLQPPARGGGSANYDMGVFLVLFTPYAEGPRFVQALRERGGGDWSRVEAAYGSFPNSSEQVLHPARYPDDAPQSLVVRDRTRGDWRRFDLGQDTDTVGEASLYAMFWANGQVAREGRSPYNYSYSRSAGWDGDTLVPYTNGSHVGYVWKLVFDSRVDADEFVEGYTAMLQTRGARKVRDGVYRIPHGPYADAFRIERHGHRVVITNAPSVRALDRLRG